MLFFDTRLLYMMFPFSGMLSLVPSFLPGKFLLIFQNLVQVFPWVSCKQNYSVFPSILYCFILKVMTAKRLCGDSTVSFLGKFTGGLLWNQTIYLKEKCNF